MILKAFNDWHEWAAYFLFHYEEFLLSEFYAAYVMDQVDSIGYWVLGIGIYLFFWPITFPLTAMIPIVLFGFGFIAVLFG